MNCENLFGGGWIVLDFLPQLGHMCIDGATKRKIVVAPNRVQQLIPRHYVAAMLDEIFQDRIARNSQVTLELYPIHPQKIGTTSSCVMSHIDESVFALRYWRSGHIVRVCTDWQFSCSPV
jgi:hypothetical protein